MMEEISKLLISLYSNYAKEGIDIQKEFTDIASQLVVNNSHIELKKK